jgi:hypothetical protein
MPVTGEADRHAIDTSAVDRTPSPRLVLACRPIPSTTPPWTSSWRTTTPARSPPSRSSPGAATPPLMNTNDEFAAFTTDARGLTVYLRCSVESSTCTEAPELASQFPTHERLVTRSRSR